MSAVAENRELYFVRIMRRSLHPCVGSYRHDSWEQAVIQRSEYEALYTPEANYALITKIYEQTIAEIH